MRLFPDTAAIRSAASNRTVAATMCALVVAMSTASAVHAADERPDLKLEIFSLPSPRQVQVRVTNISVWWATGSQLNVETVSPVAGNLKRLDIGNLDPGESFNLTYTLAAECNGDVVKASVTPAKNYAGVAETELNNNQLQSQACPAQEPDKPGCPHLGRGWPEAALQRRPGQSKARRRDRRGRWSGRRAWRRCARSRAASPTQHHDHGRGRPGSSHCAGDERDQARWQQRHQRLRSRQR